MEHNTAIVCVVASVWCGVKMHMMQPAVAPSSMVPMHTVNHTMTMARVHVVMCVAVHA